MTPKFVIKTIHFTKGFHKISYVQCSIPFRNFPFSVKMTKLNAINEINQILIYSYVYFHNENFDKKFLKLLL